MKIDHEKLIKQSNGRIKVEDMELLERVCDVSKTGTILEIGSADGGSSVVLANKARELYGPLAMLYCIEPAPRQKMVDNMAAYSLQSYYRIIKGASPWVGRDIVPDEIDLLFIDGYHLVRWALMDYHYWAPRVCPGGIIVFHDTSGGCKEDRAQKDFGKADYVPQVMQAIEIILRTDDLIEVDRSNAENGGAIAFRKP